MEGEYVEIFNVAQLYFPSVNTVALAMVCGARGTRRTCTPVIKH